MNEAQIRYKHPRHFVAVDCIIFGYKEGKLNILLYPRGFEPEKGIMSLPGGFVQNEESAEDAAIRVLKKITGLDRIFMEQVAVYSDPKREKEARVVSIAYYALIRIDEHDEGKVESYGAKWCPVAETPGLVFDHNQMVSDSLKKLHLKASYELIGRKLLPELFTLTQLRNIYGAIFQREFDPGNFRKKILSLDLLERTDKKDITDSKKGSFYYRYKKNVSSLQIPQIVKL